jgi:hypothetical protein
LVLVFVVSLITACDSNKNSSDPNAFNSDNSISYLANISSATGQITTVYKVQKTVCWTSNINNIQKLNITPWDSTGQSISVYIGVRTENRQTFASVNIDGVYFNTDSSTTCSINFEELSSDRAAGNFTCQNIGGDSYLSHGSVDLTGKFACDVMIAQ